MPFKDIFGHGKGDKGDKGKKKQENAGDQRWLREQQSGEHGKAGTFEFLQQQALEESKQKLEKL